MVGTGGRTRFCQMRDAPMAPAAAPMAPAPGIAHIQGLCEEQTCQTEGETEQACPRIQKCPSEMMTNNVIAIATKAHITATPATMTPRENRPTCPTYQL